jgi:hypothetical protein
MQLGKPAVCWICCMCAPPYLDVVLYRGELVLHVVVRHLQRAHQLVHRLRQPAGRMKTWYVSTMPKARMHVMNSTVEYEETRLGDIRQYHCMELHPPFRGR